MNKLKLASRISFLLALLALALPGCGDDDGPAPTTDGGPGEDAALADAGDTVAPTVVATSPVDGASLVATDTAIAIAFSEPMDETVGEVTATTDDGEIELGTPTWSVDGSRVTFQPPEALPAATTITVTVGASFRDTAGHSLEAPYSFAFTTLDDEAPTIVRTTPSEGATDVDPQTAAIELELSEPMRVALGTARIEGPGEPALGAVAWTDRVARWTVSGLEAESSYRVLFEGFQDLAGNPLDTSALGDDGALDFTTGADVTAPVVVESTPREGQLDVDVGLISRIALTFSEPMNESAGTFTLEVDGESVELAAAWDRGGRRAVLDVAGRLASAAPHRVVLSGLEDRAGNALDGATYLGDGALDFTTGADLFVPFVAFTSPEEGSTDASARLEIVVVFSEAMDTSTTSAPLTGDGRTVVLEGTWSSGDTVLTLSAPMLQAGRSYQLDLTGFRDAGGTPVDATHPYLGDGIADFTLRAPTGETCGDALTEAEATTVGSSRVEWVIPAGAVTRGDGSAPCDPDGHGADVLVRYRKTTPAARDGGTALHIYAERSGSSSSVRLDLDILAGDCRAGEPVSDPARLRCLVERTSWDQWLDVGPGDYFIWAAIDNSSSFPGARIVVEEVPTVREGESCDAPLTTSSSAVYTPPSDPTKPHRWVLPAGYADALDRGRSHTDEAARLSCFPEDSWVGHDAVVQLDKASDTSLVTFRISTAAVSNRVGGIALSRSCDPSDPAYGELACLPYTGTAMTREITIDGPAGPVYAWLAERRATAGWGDSPQTTIEATEFEPQLGDTCANAIPITPGTTNVVTATRPWRAHVPACLATGGVTWFRYTPTQGLGVLRTNGSTFGAVVDAATGQVLRCGEDPQSTMPVFGVPGQDVCIALTSTPAVSQISIDEIPYSGVRGIETAVPIQRAAGSVTPLLGGSGWYVRQGDRILAGRGGTVFSAPIGGGEYTWESVSINCRYGAVARPEGTYCVAETTSATAQRLYRITDADGTVLATPEPIDDLSGGFTYASVRIDGLTFDGTQFLLGTKGATTGTNPTTYYAIPATGGVPTVIGTNNLVNEVRSLAADADYLYVYGLSGTAEGIYRLSRARLDDPDQVPVVLTASYDLPSDGGHVVASSNVAAGALYFRTAGSTASGGAHVIVIVDPRGDAPRWVGPMWRASGTRPDWGLGLDPSGPTLWFVDSNITTAGTWFRLD